MTGFGTPPGLSDYRRGVRDALDEVNANIAAILETDCSIKITGGFRGSMIEIDSEWHTHQCHSNVVGCLADLAHDHKRDAEAETPMERGRYE